MGTTAQKLQRVLDTKSGLKDTINTYLGQDITEAIPFKDYETYIKNFYNSLPKTEYAEGTELTLSNTLKGKLDFENDIVGIGDTSQKSYEGYNLCEAKMPTTTATQGITFTNNGDGTYTVSGTNSSETSVTFRINQSTQIGGDNLQNYEDGTYTLDLGIADANMGISLMQNVSWTTYLGTGYGTRLVSRAITNATNTFIYVAVKANASFSTPVTIKPMFVKGSYTTSTIPVFEKYTGGIPSPNPSYPQDIEVVRGRNLFNDELEVGGFDGEGLNSGGNVRLRSKGYTQIESNTNYTINAKNNTSKTLNVSISYYTANDFVTHRTGYLSFTTLPYTFSIPSGCKYIRVLFKYTDESSMNIENVSNVMLEQGSQATSYLPYNTIEVKARGLNNLLSPKNQDITNYGVSFSFDRNGVLTLNGTNTATNLYLALSNDTPVMATSVNNMYTYAKKINKGQYKLNVFYYTGTYSGTITCNTRKYGESPIAGLSISNITKRIDFEVSSDGDYVTYLYIGQNATFDNFKLAFMISDGINDSDYEPYVTPQIKQLSLGDIELAKIGNYVDTIEYDVENDKVYKNKKIGKVVLNGTETWTKGETEQYRRFSTSNISTLKQTTGRIECLSNYFKYDYSATGHNVGTIFTYWTENGSIFVYPETTITTAEQLKTWLSTHNTIVYFILETPTKTEITGTLKDQIKALYYSHSFNGTTIIESNGDLPMIIKVRALKGE